MDLIMGAAYEPKRVSIKSEHFDLAVGEQVRSKRTLAEKWGWSREKVNRFLAKLEAENMVRVEPKKSTSLIVILNYEAHQKRSKKARKSTKKTSPQTSPLTETKTSPLTSPPREAVAPSNDGGFEDFAKQNESTSESSTEHLDESTSELQLNNKRKENIHTYNTREPISASFVISEASLSQICMYRIPDLFVQEQLSEFVAYWSASQQAKTNAQWQSAIVKRVISQWRLYKGKWNENGSSSNQQGTSKRLSNVERALQDAADYAKRTG